MDQPGLDDETRITVHWKVSEKQIWRPRGLRHSAQEIANLPFLQMMHEQRAHDDVKILMGGRE